MDKTKIFVSFSGARSRYFAEEFCPLLGDILQGVETFMSKDLKSGAWAGQLIDKLQSTNIGITIVTRANQHNSWLQFETGACAAGATSKESFPFLLDFDSTADLESPLADLQCKLSTKEGTFKLISDLNSLVTDPRDEASLERIFDKYWSDIEEIKAKALEVPEEGAPAEERDEAEKIDEILEVVRGLARQGHTFKLTTPSPSAWSADFYSDWGGGERVPRPFFTLPQYRGATADRVRGAASLIVSEIAERGVAMKFVVHQQSETVQFDRADAKGGVIIPFRQLLEDPIAVVAGRVWAVVSDEGLDDPSEGDRVES